MGASWPTITYGCSTGWPLIHGRVRSATNTQNRSWLKGRNIMLRCLDVWSIGVNIRIRIESSRAKTLPGLLGTDRRTAYANPTIACSQSHWTKTLRGLGACVGI